MARHKPGYDAWVHDIKNVRPYRSGDETYIAMERELGDAKYAFSDALYSGWLRQIRIPLHQPRNVKKHTAAHQKSSAFKMRHECQPQDSSFTSFHLPQAHRMYAMSHGLIG